MIWTAIGCYLLYAVIMLVLEERADRRITARCDADREQRRIEFENEQKELDNRFDLDRPQTSGNWFGGNNEIS